jgi:hypothetical protein
MHPIFVTGSTVSLFFRNSGIKLTLLSFGFVSWLRIQLFCDSVIMIDATGGGGGECLIFLIF